MKTVGFVDYYLSEWHANNYPAWIKAASEKIGEDFAVSYAWAQLDVSPEDGVSTEQWCEKYGAEQCFTIADLCEKSDFVIILSPSNPEKHLEYAKEAFKYTDRVYIDKTFAPDLETAEEIFRLAKEREVNFFSSSALRFAEELCDFAPTSTLAVTGGGRSLEEYIIHQIEMAVKVQGIGASALTVSSKSDAVKIEIEYPDFRKTVLNYKSGNSFSVSDAERATPIKSPFFENLLKSILGFFVKGQTPFDTAETLEVIRIRDAVLSGSGALGERIII